MSLGPLYNIQNNKVRKWSIQISLFDASKREIALCGDLESISVENGSYASYATVSGYDGMKMTRSAETIISQGKNVGKKNETNVLLQALKVCRSKYAAKLKAGYTEQMSVTTSTSTPFPMALKPWKDHKSKLLYPVYVQPKLDGVRMLALYENSDVKLLTRRHHEIRGFDDIRSALKKMFQASGKTSFVIDGELYSHGVNLQTISGIVRNESISEDTKATLQYYVFDCFDVNQPAIDFAIRRATLVEFRDAAASPKIVMTPTILATTPCQADSYYNQVVADGYEGIVYKSRGRPYEFDFNKEKRSMWFLKRKKQADGEYVIVGFAEGKGKDVGCIVLILATANDKTFSCVPNGSYAYRRQLYEQAKDDFDNLFKGRLAKVAYDDLSKDQVPLRGRIVQIGRDPAFD